MHPALRRTARALLVIVIGAFLVDVARAQDPTPPAEIPKGRWKNDRKIPDGYDRIYVGPYEVQFNTEPELAQQIGAHLDQMFDVFRKLSPPKRTLGGKLCVKIFRSHQDFRDYGAPPGAAAYFSPLDEEMVGYDTGIVGGKLRREATGNLFERWAALEAMDVLGVFNHEGWHQYFHWACGSKIDFPAWCDEGIAEYFYSAWFGEDEKVVIGAPNDVRLPVIQAAIARGKLVPFDTFVTYTQAPYYRDAGHNYAQGWAFTHFLMLHPEYREQEYVRKFVKVFIDQHSIEKTVPRVFKRVDWRQMEADFKAWVMAIPQRVNPNGPDAEERLAFNLEADRRRAELPEKIRAALEASITLRPPPPWPTPTPPAAAEATEETEETAETPTGFDGES